MMTEKKNKTLWNNGNFVRKEQRMTNLKNHEIEGNKFHLPIVQDGPCNPYFVVQMHQLQNNKQLELQVVFPVFTNSK